MAEECLDNDYIQAYSRFFAKFARVEEQPEDDVTVQMRRQEIQEKEILGEIINEAVQYLDSMNCPPSLQAFLVRQVVREMQTTCKDRPEDSSFVFDNSYSPLRLSRAITNKVNEICWGYMDNSKLGSLPSSSVHAFPQVFTAHIQNSRRTMEDRHIVLHDLNDLFSVKSDSPAHYYAVFDGHRGRGAAMYCTAHLHRFLVNSEHYPSNPARALREAFLKTDAQYIEQFNKRASSGTTATCALVIDKKLYVAWVGDSLGILVRGGAITLLVNPHRLHRRDEVERIINNGGTPVHSHGVLRVNGFLENSRSIGDAEFKPFVTGEPEITCDNLNGTEDFLVIATDGLWDHVQSEDVMKLVYLEILQRPNSIRDVHEVLFERAKANGSQDNITIVLVFLTPVEKIAERLKRQYQTAKTDPDELLNNMDSNNPPNANGLYEFTTNGAFIKEAAQLVSNGGEEEDEQMKEMNHIIYENLAKNKSEIERAEYDYTEDLGPETNVDTVDDIPPSSPNYLDDQYRYFLSNHSAKPNKYEEARTKEEDADEEADNDSIDSENSADCDSVSNVLLNAEHPGAMGDQDKKLDGAQLDGSSDVLDDASHHVHVEYDDAPPSPQATKPLQHALIPEADNVADTEDSEDEWNYYHVDPNQQKESVALVDEQQAQEDEPEAVSSSPEPPGIQEDKVQAEIERDIRCESPAEEVSPEHIDTKSNAEEKEEVEETSEETFAEKKPEQESEEMDYFKLNPDAEEFVPVSPQILGARINLGDDYPISGSPLKQVPQMDDIQLPSQTEFDEEVCRRPRDVEGSEKECINGDRLQYPNYSEVTTPRQRALAMPIDLDESEISSTRAEFGDESATSFLTASEFHRTGVSNIDDSFGSSFTPSDFAAALEAALEEGVDLNAVHDLTDADAEDKNGLAENEHLTETPEMQSQEDLISSELEQVVRITTLNNEEQSEPVHTPAVQQQLEDAESTFVEDAIPEKAKLVSELELQQAETPSSEAEHEDIRAEHSPLVDHYSAEFESEKEPMLDDNEQPLSSSSIDIDKTKPIDEASEEAALPTTDSQKDDDLKDDDVPSSLSSVPDAMDYTTPQKEFDLADSMKYVQISSTPIVSQLHYDACEFKPARYNFNACDEDSPKSEEHPVLGAVDTAATQDNVQKEEQLIDVEESEELPPQEIPVSIEEPVAAEEPEEPEAPKQLIEPEEVKEAETFKESEEPKEEKLLDFCDESEVCPRSEPKHFEVEMTPPLSPTEPEHNIAEDKQESCPVLSDKVDAEVIAPKVEEEIVMKSEVCEVQALKETSYPVDFESEVHQGSTGMNLSESMQEFTGLEKQLVPEQFCPEESKPAEIIEPLVTKEEEPKPVEVEAEVEMAVEVQEHKEPESEPTPEPAPQPAPEPTPESAPEPEIQVQEVKEVEIAAPVVPESISIEPEIKKEEVPEVAEVPEKPVVEDSTTSTTAATVAVATAFATAAAATTIAAAVSPSAASKPKTTKLAPKLTKTATTKTTTKTTPLSPSKSATATSRASATGPAKKLVASTTARPKETDTTKKSAATTASKVPASKPATAAKSSTSTTAARTTTTRTSTSAPKPRTSGTLLKPASVAADKKPTLNGDVKASNKPTAPRTASKPATTASSTAAKSSLVKTTTTTRTSAASAATAPRPRPTSAATQSKTSTAAKSTSSATGSAATTRPKTAPNATTTVAKSRVTSTVKSPMIDKQIKETANKQISLARTTTSTASKTTTSRTSTSVTSSISTTMKRTSATAKTATAGSSPTKKQTSTTKVAGRVMNGTKTTSTGTSKRKIVQNGVSEITEISSTTVISADNKIEDDIPKKDLSPVVVPTDNQLITSSD